MLDPQNGSAVSCLSLSNDEQLLHLIDERLADVGFASRALSSAAEVNSALLEALPEALLVDLASQRRMRVRLLEEVRRNHPAAQVPLVIFHKAQSPPAPELCARLKISLCEDRSEVPSDFGTRLQSEVAKHQESLAPGQAHPYALETLARVWRQGLSGLITLPDGVSFPVCEGGLINPNNLPLLEQGLTASGMRFFPGTVFGLGDWYTVGQSLWSAARTRTQPGFYAQHQRMLLKPRPNAARAGMLPISDATRTLLSDRRTGLPLRRHLSLLRLQPQSIEQDIEVLYLLGLYRFVPGRPKPRRTMPLKGLPPPTATRSGTPSHAGLHSASQRSGGRRAVADPKLKERMELRRLKREVETLTKADDWTVLGIQPTTDARRIEEAGTRMQTRYAELANTHTNPTARNLAQQIGTCVVSSLDSLRALLEVYRTFGTPSEPSSREEIAFREGFSALRRRDSKRALQLFLAAYDECMQSSRNLAYLGWATFQHHGSSQLDSATEYLQLADSLQPGVPQTQFFLATVESKQGNLERAEKRLTRLIKQGEGFEEAHSLYRQVRQMRQRK